MRIRDIMRPVAHTATPETTLREAAELMDALQLVPLPVCEGNRLVGVLTRKALDDAAEKAGLAAAGVSIRDAVVSSPATLSPDEDVDEAAARLSSDQEVAAAAVIPVAESSGELAGVVAVGDLLKASEDVGDGVAAAQNVQSVDSLVGFDASSVEYMVDQSFPASDPPPPPSSMGVENLAGDEGASGR